MDLDPNSLGAMCAAIRARSVAPGHAVQRAVAAAQADDLAAWVFTTPSVEIVNESDLPLRGIPFGVKDIIDVRGMPTRAGTTFMGDTWARDDAWCVAALRAAGAT